MSAGTVRVGAKRLPDRTHYLCTESDCSDALLNRAELARAAFSVVMWSDNARTGSLRIEQRNFSVQLEMTADELRSLAGALTQCADDLAFRAAAAQLAEREAA